jgi:sterol desaturase/sphingolipid hydroxylase (fatty acid hydroxylase superfamily)
MGSLTEIYHRFTDIDARIWHELIESGRTFCFWFIIFFVISKLLPKPAPGKAPRNLQLVHTKRPIFNSEFWMEFSLPFFNAIVSPPLTILQQVLFIDLVLMKFLPHQIFQSSISQLPYFVQVFLAVVVFDLALYVRHRFVHEFAWPYHAVHHAAREISFLTTNRLHPIDTFIMGFLDAFVLHILGFESEAFIAAAWIKQIFNMVNHSNMCFDFGSPLRYIFVSPNMHRWHHCADDPKAFNTNYCIVFAWIDVLFGTFYCPKDRLPNEYGVFNSKGESAVPLGLWNQLLYPFKQNWKFVKRQYRRYRRKRTQ